MFWFALTHLISFFVDLISIGHISEREKDLEMLILRQQLSILHRKLKHPVKPSRIEKMTLAVLTVKLKQLSHQSTNHLRDLVLIFQPETILR